MSIDAFPELPALPDTAAADASRSESAGDLSTLFQVASHNPSFKTVRQTARIDGELTDFCVPVNHYFPPSELVAQIRDNLGDIVKYYPDYAEVHERHISRLAGIDAAHIVVANGSTEIITALCRDTVEPMATAVPTFGRWTDLPEEFGVPLMHVHHRKDRGFRVDVQALITTIRARRIRQLVICNPNNPTGAWFTSRDIETLVETLDDLDSVVIDESFIDFSDLPSAQSLAVARDNVIVVKSLGKSLGWHGIRLGYAVTSVQRAEALRARLPYWNINGLAAFVLEKLASYMDDYRFSFEKMARDRAYMLQRLRVVPGLTVYPSKANFVYVELPYQVSGSAVRDELLRRFGLLVRECGNKVGSSESYLRLAVHPWQVVDRLVTALRQVLSEAGQVTAPRVKSTQMNAPQVNLAQVGAERVGAEQVSAKMFGSGRVAV